MQVLFTLSNPFGFASKAAPLAAALRRAHGTGAIDHCRAALARPELTGARRRLVEATLHVLLGPAR